MVLKLVEHSEKHQIKIHISIGICSENVNLGFGSQFQCFVLEFLEMVLKLVEHSEKHQTRIHISIGICSENVNLGVGSHFQCFG